jgi:hypothetical protein
MPKLRIRGSAAFLFVTGLVLAFVAIACASSTMRVHRPIALAGMYLWFAALSFFAAWVSQTQARITN